jgi:hypothetical protein
MDLVDRIETTRFLGSEFVLWLWFSQDSLDGLLKIPALGAIEVTLGTQLMLADPLTPKESVHVRGQDPCGSSEAEQALHQGKLPRKVGLRFTFEQNDWVFTLDAATLDLSGVKLPALLSEGEEEHFYERMRLFEQMHDLVRALYSRFLSVRLSPAWDSDVAPSIRLWLSDGTMPESAEYEALHASAPAKSTAGRALRRSAR